jgi:hypothetical protein
LGSFQGYRHLGLLRPGQHCLLLNAPPFRGRVQPQIRGREA